MPVFVLILQPILERILALEERGTGHPRKPKPKPRWLVPREQLASCCHKKEVTTVTVALVVRIRGGRDTALNPALDTGSMETLGWAGQGIYSLSSQFPSLIELG